MPEIKHQFTGGKMNKDLDERLVPNGEYRDAMNIQVATSEGSDVGTIQNILGNQLGCNTFNTSGGTDSYIPAGSRAIGSIADEKNDSLYWLISGSEPLNSTTLSPDDTVSFKDLIVKLKTLDGSCKPVFVDKYKFCVGVTNTSGTGNNIQFGDEDLYSQVTQGMTVTGYNSGGAVPTNGPLQVPIMGVGSITTLPVNYNSAYTTTSVPFTPRDILIGAPVGSTNPDNTNMYIRGFWNGTDFTNTNYDSAAHAISGAPITQVNLPPDGACQLWIPESDLSASHNITPGTLISNLSGGFSPRPSRFHGGNNNDTIGTGVLVVHSIVLGQVHFINTTGGYSISAWIITVGVTGPTIYTNWSDDALNQYPTGSGYNGVWKQFTRLGEQLAGDAYPFHELEALIDPAEAFTAANTATNVIDIPNASASWLDEIYNALFDDTGSATGAFLQINSLLGGGINFPPNSCIDPNSVSASVPLDSSFVIMDCATGTALSPGDITLPPFNPGLSSLYSGRPITLNIIGGNLQGIILSEDIQFNDVETYCFESDRTLNFEHNQLITGVDIIDDLMLWTDNKNEPKKINLTRSLQGTNQYGEIHTAVVNQDAQYDLTTNYTPIREEHITVIRKTPKNALNLELSDGRDPLLSYTGLTQVGLSSSTTSITQSSIGAITDFSALSVGDTVTFRISGDYYGSASIDFAWEEGGYLLLKEYYVGSAPAIPLANWTIRGLITDNIDNKFENILVSGTVQVEIKVVGINGVPGEPSTGNDPLLYVVDLEATDPVIYEDKFPRFSYRYKYEDGEHSTFAPWSEVAFLPGVLDYLPKKGWNTGMLNNVRSIKVKGFQPAVFGQPAGSDVVEVDILYKEDSSPNVYLVQTISPVDILPFGNVDLPWYLGEYIISSENIKGIIPSNQLLRPWDNVPKKALAQSVSGNRVIYANYEQNYDLKINGENYKPEFKNSLTNWLSPVIGVPNKSIKSLRDYKLGVVFTDKYGRETPVLISEGGGFRVEKQQSINANRLKVGLQGSIPADMAYYKFYIKETSSEYYNLAMDRWYKAEDGNIWLAFPSSDRNKMDLDSYLYFKRGLDGDENVIENSTKYKVLAIENEAPEFIKTRRIRIGTVIHLEDTRRVFGEDSAPTAGIPRVNGVSFSMRYDEFKGTSLSKMEDIKEDIYVQFVSSGDVSTQYKVSEITSDRNDANGLEPGDYFVTLDTNLKDDINHIYDDASAVTKINDDTKVIFTKAVIENKPKFDGRFFAKIENDGKIQTQITDDSVGVNYIETASKKVYMLENDSKLRSTSPAVITEPGTSNILAEEDFSSQVDDAVRNHNTGPSGINWNYLVARECYFHTGGESIVSNGQAPNTPNAVNPPDSKNALKRWISGTNFHHQYHVNPMPAAGIREKMGVWFIDKSTKKYTIPTSGPDDNNFSWTNSMNMNEFSPAAFSLPSHTVYGNVGEGITHDAAANSSFINLGFGGFGDPSYADWKKGGDVDSGFNLYTKSDWVDFYDVGGGNPIWNDPATVTFTAGLNAGFYFRWREDPTETIYKVEEQTTYRRDLRFSRGDDGLELSDGTLDIHTRPIVITAPSSYTKTFGFKVTPSMAGWDPSATPGTLMTNGLKLGEGVVKATYHFGIGLGATSIAVASVDGIKVGMSVGYNSYCDPLAKVTAIDAATNLVTIDLGTTAAAAAGVLFSFAFAIRIVSDYMFGFTNTTEPRNNYITVDGIESECSNGNTLKPTYKLHKGMKLQAYNIDTNPTNPWLAYDVAIKEITEVTPAGSAPGVKQYKLKLAGYQAPANTYHVSFGAANNAFIVGERMQFVQVSMNGASNFTEEMTDLSLVNLPISSSGFSLGQIVAVGYDMVMMEPVDEYSDGGNLPENPFIWETEPKEDTGLDIYYEISENNPVKLNKETINTAIPVDSTLVNESGQGGLLDSVTVAANWFASGQEIQLSEFAWIGPGNAPDGTPPLKVGSVFKITKPNGVVFGIKIESWIDDTTDPSIPFGVAKIFKLNANLHYSNYRLNWHNCYSFGNGVESNRIKDIFNSPFITNGVKASATLGEDYKREHRKNGLIYSGIYNSTSGVNNLNQFIQAEKITKDINPIYGSIQKLHAGWGQGGDLVALCEDRILKILANKDALFNADGNPQLTATNSVLGQAIPYSGEYGISKNPESFASEAYRIYFTDKVRGAVMRLSKDGLTPISDAGMKDWFRDNLKLNSVLTGSYDDKKDEYNITLKQIVESSTYPEGLTVSFKEDVRGWVSFKSFAPENAISCANEYYTFKDAIPWLHHVQQFSGINKEVGRNTFYNVHSQKDYSSFNVILNDAPGSVKSFNTINYEGSQSKVNQFLIDAPTGLSDGEYYNLKPKKGWYVDSIFTNKEVGVIDEFIEKEGKWFNYIKGKEIQLSGQYVLPGETLNPKPLSNFDLSSLAVQGLGRIMTMPLPMAVDGCTDSTALNYNANAVVDDGSCNYAVYGCTDPTASNYDSTVNTDDGSCYSEGCMDATAINYNSSADVDDGSCYYPVYGCTDATQFNYNLNANMDDGSCIPFLNGCTDATAFNYDVTANTDDGSCIATALGCTDSSYIEYNALANTDDGSCVTLTVFGCTNNTALNWNPSANMDNGTCILPVYGCMDGGVGIPGTTTPNAQVYINWDPLATVDDGSCIDCIYGCTLGLSPDYDPGATCYDGACTVTYGCMDPAASNYNAAANVADGSCSYCVYGCTDSTQFNYDANATCDDNTCTPIVLGCTDAFADNYNAWLGVNTDDGSCTYPVLAIGDYHQGGRIFYLDPNGGGLIAAPSDSPNLEWGCLGTNISGALSYSDGAQNTTEIVAGCNEFPIAAKRAANLITTFPILGDWYLPSQEQLATMFNNIGPGATGVNTFGTSLNNIGGFVLNGDYWSSRTLGSNGNHQTARFINSTSNLVSNGVRNAQFISRPIRSF